MNQPQGPASEIEGSLEGQLGSIGDGRGGVLAMRAPEEPASASPPSTLRTHFFEYGLPGILFLLSVGTTTAIGSRFMQNFRDGQPAIFAESDLWPWPWILQDPSRFLLGWPFSVALLSILLAHEFGHYIACRTHGIRATLPWVLPAPTLSGTIGAVIQIRDGIPNRRALMDVGVYGPIAGFAASLIAICAGFLFSSTAPRAHSPALISFGLPPAFHLIHGVVSWLRPGTPGFDPAGMHPVLIAGWVGLFITFINLIPAGQLDGGHILYALSPTVHKWVTRVLPVALFAAGYYFWVGWFLWGLVLLIPIMRHPRVPDEGRLGPGRIAVSLVALAIFVVTFTAQPFDATSLMQYLKN